MTGAIVLADLATRINIEHAGAVEHARSAVQCARQAGELLLQAKEQCRHGEWLPWLKANCPSIAERTAQAYMRLARYCLQDPIRAEVLTSLTLQQALVELADSSLTAERQTIVPKSATVADLDHPQLFRIVPRRVVYEP